METIITSDNETIVVSQDTAQVIVTGIMGPPGSTTIANMTDVDKTELTDGAVLVYKAQTAVWKATNRLDSQILEAGQF